MAGMLQILTYMLAFYFVLKGIEILMIAAASKREDRRMMFLVGALTLVACCCAGLGFSFLQDRQAESISQHMPSI
jgi:uncharacterized membrane protein HdeD (DUF308 family)